MKIHQNRENRNVNTYGADSYKNITHELPDGISQIYTIQSLCLILPFYNEQDNLSNLINSLIEYFSDTEVTLNILLVDDGSTDGSLAVAHHFSEQNNLIDYISFSRNFGKEAAIMGGLIECGNSFDAIAYMDSDGQHTPEDLAKLIEAAQPRNVDLVCGVRMERDYQTPTQRRLAKAFYKIFRAISNASIDEGAGDFNVLKMPVVKAIRQMNEPYPFMKGVVGWVGFKRKLVPIHIAPRSAGTAKSSTSRMFKLALSAILSFSSWPLRIWSAIGALSAVLAVAYLLVVLINTIVNGREVPGYASTLILLLGVGGLQLFSIGIVGEYVARIYETSKNRPRYIIAQRADKNEK